jgi:hypothetical protein
MIDDKPIVKLDEAFVLTKQQRIYSRLLNKKIKHIRKQAKVPYEVKVFYMAEFFKLHKNKEFEVVYKDCVSLFELSKELSTKQQQATTSEVKEVVKMAKIDEAKKIITNVDIPKLMTDKDDKKLIDSIFKF